MAITTVPVVSEPIYLSDKSSAVAKLEGKSPKAEKAWVRVRQATEQDSMMLEESLPDTRYEYFDETGPNGRPIRKTIETRNERVRDRFAMQVWLCLCDAGNINTPSGPLFKFKDAGDYQKYDGNFDSFLKVWGQLPPSVAVAIRDVVYDYNPHWDWRGIFRDADEGEEEAET